MIKILRGDGTYAPVFVCDICGKRIENARKAAAVNKFNRETISQGDLLDVMHVHKGKCHDEAEANMDAAGVSVPGWLELQHHLVHLVHNVGLSPEDLANYNKMLDESGLDELP